MSLPIISVSGTFSTSDKDGVANMISPVLLIAQIAGLVLSVECAEAIFVSVLKGDFQLLSIFWPVDVDDITKIAKGKVDALKIKDSAIKIKLEIAKLQNDIIADATFG
jgi:hypothetical protein